MELHGSTFKLWPEDRAVLQEGMGRDDRIELDPVLGTAAVLTAGLFCGVTVRQSDNLELQSLAACTPFALSWAAVHGMRNQQYGGSVRSVERADVKLVRVQGLADRNSMCVWYPSLPFYGVARVFEGVGKACRRQPPVVPATLLEWVDRAVRAVERGTRGLDGCRAGPPVYSRFRLVGSGKGIVCATVGEGRDFEQYLPSTRWLLAAPVDPESAEWEALHVAALDDTWDDVNGPKKLSGRKRTTFPKKGSKSVKSRVRKA